jgi:hypothetical protein
MATQNSSTTKSRAKQPLEGEGSYSASRAYNRNLGRALADKRGIERGAEAARKALDGSEGPALRAAEKRAKSGPRVAAKRGR